MKSEREERRGGKAFAFALLLALLFAGLGIALGLWQLQRLAWKSELIARIEARVHAAPTALPPASQWPGLVPGDFEYRHVTVSGVWLAGGDAEALALTERGTGIWAMAPLKLDDGSIVYVNRGFVPQERKGDFPVGPQAVTLTGLMRPPEPGGLPLRPNEPEKGRWFSRDVAAMAQASGLGPAAPFFIDRDAGEDPAAFPAGGMTRIDFPNNHLLYAVQFFALALIAAGGAAYLLRQRRGERPQGARPER